MPQLLRPTVTLDYTAVGEGPPAVVLLHGWCDGRETWDPLIELLQGDLRCLALDQRGHGGSGLPLDHDFGLAALTNDVAALLDGEKAERAVIVGHSYGGAVAAAFAARHPARARAVMVIDQPLVMDLMAELVGPHAGVIRDAGRHMGFRREMLAGLMGAELSGRAREGLQARIDATTTEVALAYWALLFESNGAELGRLTDMLFDGLAGRPTTILAEKEVQPYHETVRRRLPRALLRVVGGGGHYLQLTRTALVAEAIRELVARSGEGAR